jgi:hypothetical protein
MGGIRFLGLDVACDLWPIACGLKVAETRD